MRARPATPVSGTWPLPPGKPYNIAPCGNHCRVLYWKFEPFSPALCTPGYGCHETTPAKPIRYRQDHRMSALAINPIHRAVRFYEAPIGKKAVMAITGLILFGYVVGHLLGNLQIYSADHDQINRYAAFLHNPANAVPLWAIRAFLFLAVVLHVTASIQLWLQNRIARPIAYVRKNDVPASYAARTMLWSGPIVGAFIVFHVLHLTVGAVLPLQDVNGSPITPDVYHNVIAGFQNPWVSGFYILAMILLCMHLYHGLWSMFQSMGIDHPRYTPLLKKGAAIAAILIAIGNCSIPIAVMAGLLTL
ncbi:Succinate dehydrogenase subunit C [Candidatus Sulfopaludibacter sp. SbA6]|nr:Succinate dehydrogenase subunit C [Candidatus Sulfopaludibacter sp. SbA6]